MGIASSVQLLLVASMALLTVWGSQGRWILSQWLASPRMAPPGTIVPRDSGGSFKASWNFALEVSQCSIHYVV